MTFICYGATITVTWFILGFFFAKEIHRKVHGWETTLVAGHVDIAFDNRSTLVGWLIIIQDNLDRTALPDF